MEHRVAFILFPRRARLRRAGARSAAAGRGWLSGPPRLVCLLAIALLGAGPARPAYVWTDPPLDGGGAVTVLAPSPHDPAQVLAGGPTAGLQRSVDSGRTWRPANRDLSRADELAIADIAWHPRAADRAYAAVGLADEAPGRGAGALLISLDGGFTWQPRSYDVGFGGGPERRQVGPVLLTDPFEPDHLWAATAWDGVQHSADGGRTWRAFGLQGRWLHSLGRTVDGTLWAAAEPGGLLVQPAGGGEWRPLYPGPVTCVATALSDPERALIATPDAGLLLSEDGGESWINVTPAGFADRLVAESVRFSSAHPRVGVALGRARPGRRRMPNVFLTLDGGRTWQPLVEPNARNVRTGFWWAGADWFGFGAATAAFEPWTARRVWLGDALSVWHTPDGAAAWYGGHQGLRTARVQAIALDPRDLEVAYVGVAGAGAFKLTRQPRSASPLGGNLLSVTEVAALATLGGGAGTEVLLPQGRRLWRQTALGSWQAARGTAPGPLRDVLALRDGRVLAAVDGAPLQVSGDRGDTWQVWGRPPTAAGQPVALDLPVALDADLRAAAALEGGEALHLTLDGGASWRRIEGDLPPVDGRRRLHHLAAQPGAVPVLYVASPLGVWKSRDLGRLWERVFAQDATALAVDSRSGQIYLGAVAEDGPLEGLYTSRTQGETWERIDDWPHHLRIRVLCPEPRVPGRVWVGLDGNGVIVGEPASGG